MELEEGTFADFGRSYGILCLKPSNPCRYIHAHSVLSHFGIILLCFSQKFEIVFDD